MATTTENRFKVLSKAIQKLPDWRVHHRDETVIVFQNTKTQDEIDLVLDVPKRRISLLTASGQEHHARAVIKAIYPTGQPSWLYIARRPRY